ncbi:MAG TPA: transglycosylase SLT domain-containing protein [Burkholderiaceae bacterium]|nr:transglycosylase SLT domain-containing protein [Burkholderiaceae bacterium]
MSPVPGLNGEPGADSQTAGDAAGRPNDPLEPDAPVQMDPDVAHADLWSRIRRGFAMPGLDSDLVREHERWYASRPDYVQRMTDRGGRYLFHVVGEVERRKMPLELALLPFIESAFNPTAMSTARASGMWQFIPSTGRDYDLKQNVFRDDRRDVLASTRAALDYLGRLYTQFNDWQLALAAYNWGEGNVKKAIARNERAGLPTDYASLSMPNETRHYVPKLLAVKAIVLDPKAFGLTLPEIGNHPYFLSVPIQRDIDVALAARLAGLTVDEFRNLNPQHSKPVILAAGTPQVLLPFDNADQFVNAVKQHRGALASWTAWVVPKTMRPADAARQVGLSEAQLREVNHIPPRMLVKAGSALLVPRSERRAADVPEHLADNAQMALAPDAPPLRKVAVKARKGDSVASLAKRYRVTPAQFAQWNRLSPSASLSAGQALVVYQPQPKAKAVTAVASRKAAPASATPTGGKSPRRGGGAVARSRVSLKVAAGRSE